MQPLAQTAWVLWAVLPLNAARLAQMKQAQMIQPQTQQKAQLVRSAVAEYPVPPYAGVPGESALQSQPPCCCSVMRVGLVMLGLWVALLVLPVCAAHLAFARPQEAHLQQARCCAFARRGAQPLAYRQSRWVATENLRRASRCPAGQHPACLPLRAVTVHRIGPTLRATFHLGRVEFSHCLESLLARPAAAIVPEQEKQAAAPRFDSGG